MLQTLEIHADFIEESDGGVFIKTHDTMFRLPTDSVIEIAPSDNPSCKYTHTVKLKNTAEIAALEAEAIAEVLDELDEDDIEDFLVGEGYDIDEIKKVSVDEDETEVTIVDLGINDEDDREAIVSLEIEVKYTLREGSTDRYKKIINAEGTFYIDDDDKEVDLVYS